MPYNAPPRSAGRAFAVVAFTALVAGGLRGIAAWWLPLQPDEASSMLERSFAHLMADEERFFNPVPWRALNVVLLDWTDSIFALRLPSILCATAACVVVAGYAHRRAGPLAAWVSGLAMACTPWMVRQQGQFRSYGFALLAAALVAVSLHAFVDRPNRRGLLLSAIAVGLAGWAHFILLPWTALWAVVVLIVVSGREIEPRVRKSSSLALVVVALLAAHPAWLALGGLMLKQGGPSASLAASDAVDVMWRPELAILFVASAALVLGPRRENRPATLVVLAVTALFGGIIVAAGGALRTVRWGHLVAIAPALHLVLGLVLADLVVDNQQKRRIVAVGVTLCAVLLGSTAVSALHNGMTRQDEADLAGWMLTHGPVDVVAMENVAVDDGASRLIPKDAIGIAHALGYFAGGPDRCVGPDVIHEPRCRAATTSMPFRDQTIRGWCHDKRCVFPVSDAPPPLEPAAAAKESLRIAVIAPFEDRPLQAWNGCKTGEAGRWWMCPPLANDR